MEKLDVSARLSRLVRVCVGMVDLSNLMSDGRVEANVFHSHWLR